MEYNRIPVIFTGRKGTAPPISYKYDQKQKITFEGIYGLPAVFTVDFCNEGDTVTKPEIGTPDGVDIPDEYLQTGRPIKAFFWLSGPNESVQTRYEIEIPVRSRPARSEVTPTPAQRSVIDELIDELNTGVEEAEQSAEDSEAWAGGTRKGVPVGEDDETYQKNSKYYSEQAGASATAAAGSATAAGQAKDDSVAAKNAAVAAKDTAVAAKDAAVAAKDGAVQAKEAAQNLVDGAVGSVNAARDAAVQTVNQAGSTQVGNVNSAGTTQIGQVNNAGATQVQTVNQAGAQQVANARAQAEAAERSATAAGQAKDDAVAAKDAAIAAKEAAQAATATKADKVTGAGAGNVAALDANGNLADNGNKYQPVPKDSTMVLRVGVDNSGRLWASGDSGSERFGVSGVGGSSTTLTRLWDAAGLSATPGTDEIACQSDFDQFPVFNRKKCVGFWTIVDDKPVFNVQAYEGDADYAEDGSMGDYVAVDVPPTYWFHDEENGILGVSGNAHPGWEPHPVCLDANGDVREHTYLPVYPLAKDGDGHAVSLPGFDPFFGHYQGVWTAARTYGDGTSFANYAIIEPSVVDHYEWLMMTVEFATTNVQTFMQGAVSMPYNASHTITAAPGANKIVLTAEIGDTCSVGQTLFIGAGHGDTPASVEAYNHITAIEKCNADGTLNESGTYRLITYDGTDRTASITPGTTKVGSRPWINGATEGFAPGVQPVLGHTGSPVSNSDGRHPMRYRWRENVYGNINITALDLFDARTADGSSYHLDWYYNDRLRYEGAALYFPSSSSKPDLTDLQNTSKGFRKLSTTTPVASYKDGYIKEEGFDSDLPCIRVPTLTTGGSATTYYADYAYLVNSSAVRAVRRRGSVTYGAYFGPRFVFAINAPSFSIWSYGAALYMVQ